MPTLNSVAPYDISDHELERLICKWLLMTYGAIEASCLVYWLGMVLAYACIVPV